MFKLPENFPTVNFPTIKIPDIKIPDIKIPSITSIDFSALQLPSFDLPSFDFPSIDTAKLTEAVRDAAYITVGLGAVVIERAQARGQQLADIVTDRVDHVRGLIRDTV